LSDNGAPQKSAAACDQNFLERLAGSGFDIFHSQLNFFSAHKASFSRKIFELCLMSTGKDL